MGGVLDTYYLELSFIVCSVVRALSLCGEMAQMGVVTPPLRKGRPGGVVEIACASSRRGGFYSSIQAMMIPT